MTNHYDHRQNRTSRSSYRDPRKSRRPASETEKGNSLLTLAAAGAGIFLLAAVSAVTISHFKGKPAAGSHETSLSETDASLTAPAVTVNGISLNGLSPDESFEALNQLFPWDMKAEYGEEQLAVENPLSSRLKEWIGTLCRSSQSGDLTLTPADLINEELKKEILIQAETFAKSGKLHLKTAVWIILIHKKESLYLPKAAPALKLMNAGWLRIFFPLSVKTGWMQ